MFTALCAALPARAQVAIAAAAANVNIGINLALFPELTRIPGYPVYYAPRVRGNFFFYDGLFWILLDDGWYSSSWYNGPWYRVAPRYVPVYILRVPVRYYRDPPHYFHGWHTHAPPRWGDHWGHDWERHRSGWDRWDRRYAPAPAPLPRYQRKYSGARYPDAHQQQALQQRNYRYRPRDPDLRDTHESARPHAPAVLPRQATPDERQGRQREPRADERAHAPPPQRAPHARAAPPSQVQQGGDDRKRGNAQRDAGPPHRSGPAPVQQQRERQSQAEAGPRPQHAGSGRERAAPERDRAGPAQERGQGKNRDGGQDKRGKSEEHGEGRGR
ncbi:MAG: hypothetical protein JNJ60_05540 [Rhodocyclaceae bacterium]|nr:hypothetical protein [Rhodocyclaceae bacterium]